MILKLLKNLYGLKDAGLTWFEHLSKGLTAMGFKPTEIDPFTFQSGSDLIVLSVDNYIILSRTKEEADKIFKELNNKGYKMTNEGNMEEYLGIMIIHADN